MTTNKENSKRSDFGLDLEEMARAGLHLGHHTSRVNPKMKPYVFGSRSDIAIIDLDKAVERIAEALEFIAKSRLKGKTLLLIGTKIQIKDTLKNIALECNIPYISERWLGGTFTNFPTLKKRIDYFKDLEKKKASGDLEKYTKKERANFEKELKDLEIKYGGIKNMDKLPDIIFVCDMIKDKLAISEAKKKGITVIAITDVDADLSKVDYPLPANDDAISSVKYILEKIKKVILENQPAAAEPKAEK